MNLVEELLKSDAKKADELKTSTFASKRLAHLIGSKKDSVEVTIKELKTRRIQDIMGYQLNNDGTLNFSKNFDAKLMIIVESLVDPDLKNKELQNYFGCSNAKELAEKLFGGEVTALSDEIAKLSGVTTGDDTEDEIKN